MTTMIGDNLPSDPAEMIRQELESDNQDILKRTEELLDAVDRVPGEIDDSSAGPAGDAAHVWLPFA